MRQEYGFYLRNLLESVPLLGTRLGDPDFSALLLLRWTLQALLITLLVFVADYLTGAGLLAALRVRVSARFRPLAALICGIGLQGMLLFALGAVGVLTTRYVRGGGLLLALAGAFVVCRAGRLAEFWRPWRRLGHGRPNWLWIALLSPLALIHVADLMQPVGEGDATMYHMVAARWYRDTAALPYHPEIRFNAHPQLSVLLYLRHWMATGDDTLLKLFNLELGWLLVAAVIAGLRELRVRARWLPFAFLGGPAVFVWVVKIEYADLALAAFLTAGGVLLVGALRRQSAPLAALGGVALALTGAVKLQGMVVAAALVLVFAAMLVTNGLRAGRWPLSRLWRVAAAWAVAMLVLDAPWWIRSYAATGSPAYPFFTQTADFKRLMDVNQTYGFGHSLGALLMLPIRTITEQPVHFADTFSYGPALGVWMVAWLWCAARLRRAPGILFLLGGTGLFFGFWFLSGQVIRYWASTLGLQALLVAAAAAAWPRWLSGVLAAGFTGLAILNSLITGPSLRTAWPPPVTFAQKEAAQAESLRYYRAMREVNNQARPEDRVYALYCEDAKFHRHGAHSGDWMGQESYFWLAEGLPGERALTARLKQAGIRFVVVDRQRARLRQNMFGFDFARSELMRVWGDPPGATRIYDDGQYAAFRLD